MGANKPSRVQVGCVFKTNSSGYIEILETYPGKALVKFLNTGYQRLANKPDILKGKVKDPYGKDTLGCFTGVGIYLPKDHKRVYQMWRDIFKRCGKDYGGKYYKHTSIHSEWENFQNFAEWFYTQKYELDTPPEIDKDLLGDGSVYSPDTCCIVDRFLNMCIIHSPDSKGYWFNEKTGTYYVRYRGKHVGTYADIYSAKEAYISGKIDHLKNIISNYSGLVEEKVIDALSTRLQRLNKEKLIIEKCKQKVATQKKELLSKGFSQEDISNAEKRRECYRKMLGGE